MKKFKNTLFLQTYISKKRSRKKIWTLAAALALVVAVLPFVGIGGDATDVYGSYGIIDDTEVTFASETPHEHNRSNGICLNDGCDAKCDGTHLGWLSVNPTGGTISDGPYVVPVGGVTGNITIGSGEVWLCLNGKTIDAGGSGSVITVSGGATLHLCDCGDTGTITNGTATNGGGVYVDGNGTFNMYGGVISDCTATNGGGVYVDSDGTFNMYGGVIGDKDTSATGSSHDDNSFKGNVAPGGLGGGVYNAGTLTMSGGYIAGNTAPLVNHSSGEGGGVYNTDEFTMSDGVISGNFCRGEGGGVYNGENATFTFSGGTIGDPNGKKADDEGSLGNTAESGGGGVKNANGTFTMQENAVIFGNAAATGSSNGGGVHSAGANFTMYGGSITGNKAGNQAGGVQITESTTSAADGSFTMYGGTISDNTCTGQYGGGVNISYRSEFTMEGGEISGNTVKHTVDAYGGGIYNVGNSFVMKDGVIKNNKAVNDGQWTNCFGGGVYSNGEGDFVMEGGVISGNSVSRDPSYPSVKAQGGGVYIGYDHTFRMTGGVIGDPDLEDDVDEGNVVNGDGGGLFITGTFEMESGKVVGNKAVNGGGVYIGKENMYVYPDGWVDKVGTVNLSGGTAQAPDSGAKITGNTADGDGGGVYNNGTLTMTEYAAISGNEAVSGGGVANLGTITMSGFAAIEENEAEDDGGGVFVGNSKEVHMSDSAAIRNNTSTNGVGGVFVDGGDLYIEDSVDITGNKRGDQSSNVMGNASYGTPIGIVGELRYTSPIGVSVYNQNPTLTRPDAGVFAPTATYGFGNVGWHHYMPDDADPTDYFVPEEGTFKIVKNGGGLELEAAKTITYNANGGNFVGTDEYDNPLSTIETKQFAGELLSDPTQVPYRDGFAFTGWYKDSGCITPWDFAADTISASGETLYAGWTSSQHTVYFNWEGEQYSQGFLLNTPTPLLPSSFERADYAFAGWDENGDGVKDYDDGALFTATEQDGETHLEALWVSANITVTINCDNAGPGRPADIFMVTGQKWGETVELPDGLDVDTLTPPYVENASKQWFTGWHHLNLKMYDYKSWTFGVSIIDEEAVGDGNAFTIYAGWEYYVQPDHDGDDDGDGIPNAVDPNDNDDAYPDWADPKKDTDGDGTNDIDDADDDGDGINDNIDPDDDNDGIPDGKDPDHPSFYDQDGDGTPDGEDENDDGIPDWRDRDDDGYPDVIDPDPDNGDPYAPGKKTDHDGDEDGDGIPNASDNDNDNDDIPDWYDPQVDNDGDGICDALDENDDGDSKNDDADDDDDGDGILDVNDPDHTDFWDTDGDGDIDDDDLNDKNTDSDGEDGVPDAIDDDDDGDGKLDQDERDTDGDGTVDRKDENDDGDSQDDIQDADDDNDGIPDKYDPDADSDGDGIPDIDDPDNDGDGVPDVVDPDDDNDGDKDWIDPDTDSDGDGIPDVTDPDDDNDGDPDAGAAGVLGTDDDDPDSDGDGIDNVNDPDHPDFWDPTKGDERPDVVDKDGDGVPDDTTGNDGIPDIVDPKNPPVDPSQDTDKDGTPDLYDPDADIDNDGIPNASDDDNDGDGIRDWYDPHVDSDNDGVADWKDTDDDGNGETPDTTDDDTDGDGILNEDDPDHPDFWEQSGDGSGTDAGDPNVDKDGDKVPNAIDKDNDGKDNSGIDGAEDGNNKPASGYDPTGDNDGDGIHNRYDPDADSDGDGIPDWKDDYPDDPNNGSGGGGGGSGGGGGGGVPSAPLKDTDGDGIPDILDDDDDNDGLLDFEDPDPLTPNVVDLGSDICDRFDDLEHGAWYEEYIQYVVENGLMEGISDALFDPNGTTSRAQIVMMLWRMEGEPLVTHPLYFADVSEGAWYADALRWTNSEGIVLGYDDGRFGTNDPVTREQIATILWRYARFKGIDTSSGESTSLLKFSDAKKISAYAISALQWACGEELIRGTVIDDGSIVLDPQGSATRAQVAAILMRFCENIL